MTKGSRVSNKVVLLEKDKFLRDDNAVAKEFHSYFNSIVNSLGITENKYSIQKNIPSSKPMIKLLWNFNFFFFSIIIFQKNKYKKK